MAHVKCWTRSVEGSFAMQVVALGYSRTRQYSSGIAPTSRALRAPAPTPYGAIVGFTGLVLPFYRELELRGTDDAQQNPRTRERMRMLRTQAHEMAVLGGRGLARGLRYLSRIHYTPVLWSNLYQWAEFCADEADATPECARDLQTMADELKFMGYSLDFTMPQAAMLIQRLDELKLMGCTLDFPAPQAATQIFDPATFDLAAYDMFIPLDPDVWCRSI
ncbi:hypothetical protein C8R44DRAFT_878130 [Mycena epipterygia]|nr:hypothetical protein C8R44DRAFT_878130 [Mycena epipterygia]